MKRSEKRNEEVWEGKEERNKEKKRKGEKGKIDSHHLQSSMLQEVVGKQQKQWRKEEKETMILTIIASLKQKTIDSTHKKYNDKSENFTNMELTAMYMYATRLMSAMNKCNGKLYIRVLFLTLV